MVAPFEFPRAAAEVHLAAFDRNGIGCQSVSSSSPHPERRLDLPPFPVVAPGHLEDLKRCRVRDFAMRGNRIGTDPQTVVIEVYPPLRGTVDLGELTVERCPPAPAMG